MKTGNPNRKSSDFGFNISQFIPFHWNSSHFIEVLGGKDCATRGAKGINAGGRDGTTGMPGGWRSQVET